MRCSLLYPTRGGGVYKFIEVARENLVGVGGFMVGTVVLDHLIGVENIGADLAPPLVGGRRGDGAAFCLCFSLCLFFSEYFRLQELQRLLFIGELASLA